MESKLDEFQALEFIRLFVTISQLGLARPELWEKVKVRVGKELQSYGPVELLEMNNCIAIEGLEIPGFWERIEELINYDMAMPEVVSIGWSMTRIGHNKPEFWRKFEKRIQEYHGVMPLADLTMITLALKDNANISAEFWSFVR